ncbi:4Fe-4S dicluster domain-containing protein [Bacillota bacterium LX-D]|nr:4Fe-4S dicluster domain-containing protein [Bacillota bacterium LX-D]
METSKAQNAAIKLLDKNKIGQLLEKWMGSYNLIAPAKEGEVLTFQEVGNKNDIIINDDLPYKSPKEILFPRIQKILNFTREGADEIEPSKQKRLLFGVRPCDLEALGVLDAVLGSGKYIDPYYVKLRENTIIVGLGCLNEKVGCFCTERGIDKGFSAACDVFFVDRGDHYEMTVLTEKGESILSPCLDLLQEGGEKAITPGNLESKLEVKAPVKDLFDKVNWDLLTEKCQGCGICTYICPTCHCFGFKDIREEDSEARYRLWDSCMYPQFTAHASGHNPRPSTKERYRQRVLHKYVYIKENTGLTACTGCGRCIRSCPAGMNIKSVVTEIMEELS